MSVANAAHKSVRAGVFSSLSGADRAVQNLLDAGFTKDQITVICSDETRERHFREFQHQQPAGAHAEEGVVGGVTVGALAGGLCAIAVGAASGAVPLILAGAAGVSAGSAMGGFVGAMLTRGVEKELSNYYEQAVRSGQVVVAVEYDGPHADTLLQRAAKLLAEAGAEPVPLPEG